MLTSQVKAQKTRLRNYLVKELGAKVTQSTSTVSEYYELQGNINIRISDHTGSREVGMINIYIPFNDPNSFILENNYTICIIKSLKDLKAFISSLIFVDMMHQEIYKLDIYKELMQTAENFKVLIKENARLKEKINNIPFLNKRETSDCVCIDGEFYKLDKKAPKSFIDGIKRVIKYNHLTKIDTKYDS
jgi:hypothetical protein